MGHLASVIGWKMSGLAVLAAIQNDDQRLSSQVSGWTLSDSELALYATDDDESIILSILSRAWSHATQEPIPTVV